MLQTNFLGDMLKLNEEKTAVPKEIGEKYNKNKNIIHT